MSTEKFKPQPNYQSYVEDYEQRKSKLASKGLNMYDDVRLTEAEFRFKYAAMRNELKIKVAEGKRKVVGNVTQYIVSEQAYKVSQAQARGLVKAARKRNMDADIYQIRTGAVDMDPFVSDFYHKLKNEMLEGDGQYLSKKEFYKEIQRVIRQEFYGDSP